ncbi:MULTISPECIES: hypothetical protein [Enterococcus]|uniref:hypothetical protein n=1 Tax=Enterococcus TaxID=1350 RepID=UPI0022E02DC2|nr:hypothetical protein [Enterococcus thailandicus]MDT2751516.1 hypothetical protein [Enterococcus thailandicus]MDT2776376.1 hypothetical protein [Enterococcus thailandicus]MDT2794915.1 hypothetical protein [Enterococcus thailandicus]
MNNKQNDFSTGFGIVAAFIVAGVASPLLFRNVPMMIAGTLLVALGIAGFGLELDKIYVGKGYINIFWGIAFLLVGILITILLPNIFTKLLLMISLMIGVFGLISGIIESLPYNFGTIEIGEKQPKENKKSSIFLIISIIVGTTGFLANVFTILAFFKE